MRCIFSDISVNIANVDTCCRMSRNGEGKKLWGIDLNQIIIRGNESINSNYNKLGIEIKKWWLDWGKKKLPISLNGSMEIKKPTRVEVHRPHKQPFVSKQMRNIILINYSKIKEFKYDWIRFKKAENMSNVHKSKFNCNRNLIYEIFLKNFFWNIVNFM